MSLRLQADLPGVSSLVFQISSVPSDSEPSPEGRGYTCNDAGKRTVNYRPFSASYFLAQKCVFKEKRAPRGSMELIRLTQKGPPGEDRKSTRLNSSHRCISYA